MHFAVRRLRSWTRRKRLCEATNRFLNRLSRSLLSVVVAFWKRTVLIIKKRVLDISAVQNRLARNACQRLLSATVAAWKLLTVSKCKMMPVASGSQLSLSFSERRSSARRDAIWRDLNSSNHSDSPWVSPAVTGTSSCNRPVFRCWPSHRSLDHVCVIRFFLNGVLESYTVLLHLLTQARAALGIGSRPVHQSYFFTTCPKKDVKREKNGFEHEKTQKRRCVHRKIL